MKKKNNGWQQPMRLTSTVFVLFSLIASGLLTTKIIAQSPSPEVSPTTEETTDDKVQGIREAVKEKVREKLDEVQKGEKRAFVGEIDEISNSTLILTTREGEKQAKINEEAMIIGKSRKEIEAADLAIGDYIIAMGYLEDADILDARRIVISSEVELPDREIAFGIVTDISTEEEVITIKNEKKGTIYTVAVTNKTKITKKSKEEIEEIKFADIGENDRLIAVGEPTENEEKIIEANIVHIIPGKAADLVEEEIPETSPTPQVEKEEEE